MLTICVDVFLSPLKPPTKSSLSPESLNASLYFIHVAGPRDEEILECIQQERHSRQQEEQTQVKKPVPQTSKLAILNRTRRKPVPGVATSHTQHEAPSPLQPVSQGLSHDAETRYGREQEALMPVNTSPVREYSPVSVSGSPSQQPWEPQPPILPPRPLPAQPVDEDTRRWSAQVLSSISAVESPPLQLQSRRDQPSGTTARASWDGGGRPLLQPQPTRPQSHRGLLHIPEDEGPKPPLPLRPRKSYERPREAAPAAPFHLTLIRRDPTHSSQWNVGTIDNIGSSPSEGRQDGSIKVEITTPSYQKFAVDTSRMSFESLGIKLPASAHSLDIARPSIYRISSNMSREAEDMSDSGSGPGPVKFTRLLQLSHPPQSSSHHRHQSSSHGDTFNLSSPKASKYPHKSNAHYHFTSIWNGHCSFVTAANGRTLKCRHTIPGPAGNTPSSAATTTVAEIRFNLPTLLPRPSSSGDQSRSPTKSPPRIGELDLSLARERAGGGLRGNSAKLGKLIIEDEGLKMLDLVVASCMGVFWKYYDNM